MYCFISLHHLLPKNPIRDFIPFRALVLFSTSVAENPTSKNIFTVKSRWLSRGKAINAVRVRPLENPGSVVEFLKQSGFEDTQIKKIISRHPRILYANVDKTLKPKFTCFQEIGLSGRPFVDFATKYPHILRYSAENKLRPSINFLRTILLTDDNVIKAIGKNGWLLCSNFDNITMPNVEILRRCGVPDCQIRTLLLRHTRFFTQNPSWLEKLTARVKKIGFKHGSRMFIHATRALGTMSSTSFEGKIKLFKSFGWSDEDIMSAFRKTPSYLTLSESKIQTTMCFLMDEIGYKPSQIAFRPNLLLYSLEKRLVPRHEALKILKSRGLLRKHVEFSSVAGMSESYFLKKYVLRYLDKVPELQEAYVGSRKAEKK